MPNITYINSPSYNELRHAKLCGLYVTYMTYKNAEGRRYTYKDELTAGDGFEEEYKRLGLTYDEACSICWEIHMKDEAK